MKQSSESTGRALAKPASPAATKKTTHLSKVTHPSVTDYQVESLQARLVKSEDDRKEERFIWFAFSGALVLTIAYTLSTAAGVVLTPIYVALLLVLSRKWGVEAFWEALYEARRLFGRNQNNNSDE